MARYLGKSIKYLALDLGASNSVRKSEGIE